MIENKIVPAINAELFVQVCKESDSGEILVTVHGGPGLSHDYMAGLEDLMDSQLSVVSYDQRCCGRSTGLVDQIGDFSVDRYVEDLEAVRRAVTDRSVYVLGHSWGGLVAWSYAKTYPRWVKGVILADSIPPTNQTLMAGGARLEKRIEMLKNSGVIPLETPADMISYEQQILPAYFADPSHPAPLDMSVYNFSVFSATFANLGDFDFSTDLNSMRVPTLLIYGAEDPFGLEWLEEIYRNLSNTTAKKEVVAQCGHYGWIERPDLFLPPIRKFLKL